MIKTTCLVYIFLVGKGLLDVCFSVISLQYCGILHSYADPKLFTCQENVTKIRGL